MDKIKRLINCHVEVTTCTLRCSYCYITQHRLFEGPLPKFKYSVDQVRKALSKERLGGTCLINICGGGETLLSEEIVDYARALLEEGHYVMIVTNGTISKRFDDFSKFDMELKERLFFKFSYHYLEFKKKGLMTVFFENIRKVRDAGCSFTLELTPSDSAIEHIEDIKNTAIQELGAMNHVTIARDEKDERELPMMTNLPRDKYIQTWGVFDSALFDYKLKIFGKKQNGFCYAGDWSIYVSLTTGKMTQCYKSYFSYNIFENPDEPIPFHAIGNNCKEHHCYNGHSFLVLGVIPEEVAPTYSELRNRICIDGSQWLGPKMNAFMSSKLFETNKEYNLIKKWQTNFYIRYGGTPFVRKILKKLRVN